MSKFYAGVRLFEPLCSKFGIHVDQFNFVLCIFAACLMGRQFQTKYSIKNISAEQRHRFAFLGGFTLALFCFGHQIMHLFIPPIVSYIIMYVLPYQHSRYIVLVFAMSYVAVTHLARQYWDYGGYTLDITGPLMVLVQRLAMLAFNLYDGDQIKKKQKLDFDQAAKHAVLEYPTPLQFFSYVMNFQTIMIGPFLFYSEYLRFIEGREIELAETAKEKEYFATHRASILSPEVVTKKYLTIMLICGCLHLLVFPFFHPSFYLTTEFGQYPLIKKIIYIIIVSPLMRQQYYFAWSLISACCLCSGLGFSGFNKVTGKPEYNLIDSFDMGKIEMATNMKSIVDGWNKPANSWLRECIYYRTPKRFATPVVFICSAIWHGFYPGYYMFYTTAGIFLQTSRIARRRIRPYFLFYFGNGESSKIYNVITTLMTMFVLNYMSVPFILLGFSKSLLFYKQLNFCGHLAVPVLLLISYLLPRMPSTVHQNGIDHNGKQK